MFPNRNPCTNQENHSQLKSKSRSEVFKSGNSDLYKKSRSMADTISMALHTSLEHLDKKDTYDRLLLVDYSSAFKTIIPNQLISKLRDLGLSSPPCNQILEFLTHRLQSVRIGRISNNDETEYRKVIKYSAIRCRENNLFINKTKELVVDFRKWSGGHAPVCINGIEMEMVKSVKFLGEMITNNRFWSSHVDAM
eukprot:g40884.t1